MIALTHAEAAALVTAANAARVLMEGAAVALQAPAGSTLAALLLRLALERLDAAGEPVHVALIRADADLDALAVLMGEMAEDAAAVSLAEAA